MHRVALSPLLESSNLHVLSTACCEVENLGEQDFAAFLIQQGLAPMWSKMLTESSYKNTLSEQFISALHQSRIHAAGSYLIHRHSLAKINETLEHAAVPYVVYKGAHSREYLYTEPALRPAIDIDILVPENAKVDAIKALLGKGYSLVPQAKNISHEITLTKGATSIDLHWDILRPGRTRIPMTQQLLEGQKKYPGYWGMSDAASLFVMLVHPIFAKYSTAPQAALMRSVDLDKLLARKDTDYSTVIKYLDIAGLKTAAWITLTWHKILTGSAPSPMLMSATKPGIVRRKYFGAWLRNNLSSRFSEHSLLIQSGLTLPAHDRFRDALRATKQAKGFKRSQQTDLSSLLKSVYS